MSPVTFKVYNRVLQFTTLALTVCLVWFAFVYYPKAVNDFTSGNFPKRTLIAPAAATSKQFPIQMKEYRIVYELESNTYYVFIEGSNLDVYLVNRNGAKLALKNALSFSDLCGLNIIYASSEKLSVPDQYRFKSDC